MELSELLDNIPVGVFATNPTGNFTFRNNYWSRLFERPLEELGCTDWLDSLDEAERDTVMRGWREAVADRRPYEARFHVYRSDGAVPAVLRAVPIRRGVEFVGHYGSLHDARAGRLEESASLIVRGISHDISNLLTIADGALEPGFGPEVNALALRAIRTASELSRELLIPAGHQDLSRVPVDLNHLVSNVANLLRRSFRGMEIAVNLDARLGQVSCYPGRIWQALANLGQNARRASEHGKLFLETAKQTGNLPLASHAVQYPNVVRLRVRNTESAGGADLERMLRTELGREQESGHGFGLAMVRQCVRAHRGSIEIYREQDRVTVVDLYLRY